MDPSAEETDLHRSFIESRLRVYSGRENLNQAIFAFARGKAELPCLLTGPSGSGKSAALAHFVKTFQQKHPEIFVLPHFVGASPHSSSLYGMLGRLCEDLRKRYAFARPVPESPAERQITFLSYLASIPREERVVLVLDALNQLRSDEGAESLQWLPDRLPPHVKVIASCITGPQPPEVLTAFERRGCLFQKMMPLNDSERQAILTTFPGIFAKTLSNRQRQILLENPASKNPLYLLVALEEIRVFASFETLEERLRGLPVGEDSLLDLFEQVFDRLEEDFDPELIRLLLSLLACSRQGLTEKELMALTSHCKGASDLFPVLRQLRPYLLNRGGLWDFYHSSIRQAVERRYLNRGPHDTPAPAPTEQEMRQHLIQYFQQCKLNQRKIEELPWQLAASQNWPDLSQLLAQLTFFEAAWQVNEFELRRFWAKVESASPLRMVDAYRSLIEGEIGQHTSAAFFLAVLLQRTGHLDEAMVVQKKLIEYFRKMNDLANLHLCLGNNGLIHYDRGHLTEAMTLLKQQEQICRQLNDPEGLQRSLGNQALILKDRGDLAGAMALHKQKEQICRQIQEPYGLQIALGNQGLILLAQGDPKGAMDLFKQQEQICRQLNDPAVLHLCLGNQSGIQRGWGNLEVALTLSIQQEKLSRQLNDSAGLQAALSNQAMVLKARGDLEKALKLHRQQEQICRQLNDPSGLLCALGDQALILQAQGDLEGAMKLHKQEEKLCLQLEAPAALQRSLGNQALILRACGDLNGAITLLQKQEQICRQLNDPVGLQASLCNQAIILYSQGALEEAMSLLKQQEKICRQLNDPAGLHTCLGNQALIIKERGRPEEAMALHKEEEQICRNLADPAGLQRSLGNQAVLLQEQGNLQEAMALLKQQEQTCRELKDPAGLQRSLGNQALILKEWGNPEGAIALHREEEQICRQFSDVEGLAVSLLNQGVLKAEQEKCAEAIPLLREAHQIASDHGYIPLARQIHEMLNQVSLIARTAESPRPNGSPS